MIRRRPSFWITTVFAVLGTAWLPAAAPAQVFYDTSAALNPSFSIYHGVPTSPIFMTSINYPTVYGAFSAWYTPTTFTYGAMPTPFTSVPYYLDMDPAVLIETARPVPPSSFTGAPAVRGTPGKTVILDVKVPPDAEVRVQGQRMLQRGSQRRFVSPPLVNGVTYFYRIHATWPEKDRQVEDTQEVTVRAGDHKTVNFTAPNAGYRATLRGGPVP
jgi:uncharacterized protein (TIGR03000 family)